eukprot:m51a1_g7193 hypothetical protein (309) ;mRNA; r:152347-153509
MARPLRVVLLYLICLQLVVFLALSARRPRGSGASAAQQLNASALPQLDAESLVFWRPYRSGTTSVVLGALMPAARRLGLVVPRCSASGRLSRDADYDRLSREAVHAGGFNMVWCQTADEEYDWVLPLMRGGVLRTSVVAIVRDPRERFMSALLSAHVLPSRPATPQEALRSAEQYLEARGVARVAGSMMPFGRSPERVRQRVAFALVLEQMPESLAVLARSLNWTLASVADACHVRRRSRFPTLGFESLSAAWQRRAEEFLGAESAIYEHYKRELQSWVRAGGAPLQEDIRLLTQQCNRYNHVESDTD